MNAILCPIAKSFSTDPNALAFKDAVDVYTYDLAEQQVRWFVKKLKDLKVTKGERVGIVAENSPLTVFIMFALHRLEATALFLSLQLTPADWQEQLKMANVRILFGQDKFLSQLPTKLDHMYSYNQLKQEFENSSRIDSCEPDELVLEKDASIIFTSSKTGHKKGVIITIENFISSATASNQITKIGAGDWWGVSLPLYHVGGLGILFRTLLSGAGSNFISDFSPKLILQQLTSKHLTHLSLVPTVLDGLVEEAEKNGEQGILDLKNMKATVLAGAASSSVLIDKIIKYDLPILSAWGMTETTAHCTCMSLDDPKTKVVTVGKPFYHTTLKLEDENGDEVFDEEGEILVKGPTVCRGYLDPNAPQPKIVNGWLHTGDLATIDKDGYVKIVGRKDDMFISGGENIHAGEIEAALKKFWKIKDVAIIPIAHPKWGHRPMMIAEAKEDQTLDPEEIKGFLKDKIAKIKIPDQVVQLPELPRTAIGKIDYKELKKNYS